MTAAGTHRPAAVLTLLVTLLSGVLLAFPAAPAVAGPGQPDHVVLVGVTGLRWSDVDPARTPTLARLARTGSVGTLSVRAAPDVTCAGEGWLTLGAGRSAAVLAPADLDRSAGCAPRLPPPVTVDGAGARIPAMAALTTLNDGLRYGAHLGMLGARVRCAAAVGPGAALAVADTTGHVARYAATLPPDPTALLAACPLAAVDLGTLPDDPDTHPSAERREALSRLDEELGRIDAARPAGSALLVAGVAESGAGPGAYQARLHVAIATGPGYDGGWLRSPSTGRTPYLQLVDVAPTILSFLGQPVPDDIAGQAWRRAGGRPDGFGETRKALVDADQAAVTRKHLVAPVLAGFGALAAGVILASGLSLRRRRATGAEPGRPLVVAWLSLATFPVATFVANLVPWWRVEPPVPVLAALGGVILAVMAGITALACLPPWGRSTAGRAVAICAVTVAVLLGDVLTGARLQLNSVLGYTALEAGRFVGFGNVAFAVLGAAALLLAAMLAQRAGRGRPAGGRRGVAVAAAVALPVIVVEGAPGLGTDVGGVLTLVPAFGALLLLVAGIRVTTGRALAVLGAGAAVVTALAVGDYLRPADERTHFGRFVASVIEGGAATTVGRKLRANADLLFAGPHTILAALALVAACVLVFRPPSPLRRAYAAQPGLRTGLRVVVVLAVLGCATNDSGIAIPLNAALVAVPLTIALCLRPGNARREPGVPPAIEQQNHSVADTDSEIPGPGPADTPARGAGSGAKVLP